MCWHLDYFLDASAFDYERFTVWLIEIAQDVISWCGGWESEREKNHISVVDWTPFFSSKKVTKACGTLNEITTIDPSFELL
jgi:hypothetical protein